MAQVKVNGAVASGQFLTGTLSFFIVDAVDGGAAANIANFGYTAGAADPGEKVVFAVQTVATPVLIQSANARVMYVATEVGGVTAAALQTAVRSAGFANATVTAGTLTVV
jgi:hypothetical protein